MDIDKLAGIMYGTFMGGSAQTQPTVSWEELKGHSASQAIVRAWRATAQEAIRQVNNEWMSKHTEATRNVYRDLAGVPGS